MTYKKPSGFKMKSSPAKLFGSKKRKARREEEKRLKRRRDQLEHTGYVMGDKGMRSMKFDV